MVPQDSGHSFMDDSLNFPKKFVPKKVDRANSLALSGDFEVMQGGGQMPRMD